MADEATESQPEMEPGAADDAAPPDGEAAEVARNHARFLFFITLATTVLYVAAAIAALTFS